MLTAEADFADLFEVKGRAKPRTVATSDQRGRRAGDQQRPPRAAAGAADHRGREPGGGRRHAALARCRCQGTRSGRSAWRRAGRRRHPDDAALPARAGHRADRARPSGCASGCAAGRRSGPPTATWPRCSTAAWRTSGALRIFDPEHPALAGGRGRRTLVHGAVRPGLAADRVDAAALGSRPGLGTLRTLAAWQGEDIDPASEEEPGKILHEVRFGPAASFALGGRSAYYGSVDATAAVRDAARGTAALGRQGSAVVALLPHADRALDWIETLRRRRRRRLRRVLPQDQPTAWRTRAGRTPGTASTSPTARSPSRRSRWPRCRATSTRPTGPGPSLARHFGDERGARRCGGRRPSSSSGSSTSGSGCRTAAGSRSASTGTSGRSTRSTSNIGHCLWTGIADKDKAGVGGQAPDVRRRCSAAGGSARWPRRWPPTTR